MFLHCGSPVRMYHSADMVPSIASCVTCHNPILSLVLTLAEGIIPSMQTDTEYLSVSQAMAALGKSRQTVHAMIARQELTAFKIADRLVIPAVSIEAAKARVA